MVLMMLYGSIIQVSNLGAIFWHFLAVTVMIEWMLLYASNIQVENLGYSGCQCCQDDQGYLGGLGAKSGYKLPTLFGSDCDDSVNAVLWV